MKLAKTLAIVACAGLLSAGVIGSARHAYAQDATETDQTEGAWSAGGTGSADIASSPESKGPPLIISGCWDGDVEDAGDGTGSATFAFVQSSNGKDLVNGTHFDFEWSDQTFARGNMKGTVSANGIKFHGNAGRGCPMNGTATGTTSALTGKVKFGGQCAKFLKHVVISISPCS
jgi:hypothetical protein